ncbi:MAG TPA: ABC transporter substrate-binding protein, partial [Gaiellaceae bacterium]|nr:ABC transporter substrate-binding protein [Gaiellaceae bacterium]
CGGGDDSGSTGGTGGTGGTGDAKTLQPSAAEGAKGDVAWCIGKDTTGAFEEVITMHNEQNPDVKVKLIELPASADEQRTQQIQRLRAKSPECDVLGMDVIWTAEYAAQGWLTDLTAVVEDRKDEFIPSTLDTAKYEDKYWALPFNTNAGFLYYRSDTVKQAPTTWEDVYKQAQSQDGLVYQGARYEGLTVNFLELLYSAGGTVLSDDGTSVEVNSPEAKTVLEFMALGIQSGATPKAVTTYMEEESRRAFEAGKATFMRNWPYAYALGNESKIKGKFDITTFPSYGGAEGAGVLGGYDLAISAYSKNPEAALEFINFVTSAEPQKVMATKASLPPTLTATYDDPEVKKALPFEEQLREAIEQAKPRPVSPVYPQISEAIYTNVHAVLSGQSDPDSALQDMSSQIESALETF